MPRTIRNRFPGRARSAWTWALGLALLGGCAGSGDRPPESDAEQGYLAAEDGTRLFYRKLGHGPETVILPADLFLYPDFQRLAEGRTLIFYDMRNRGRSDSVSAERSSIRADVADLEAVRRHFGVDRADLVGFSYLGLMVAIYAKEFPDHVRRVVQLGPTPYASDRTYPPELTGGDYLAAMDSAGVAELRALREQDYHLSHPQEYCEKERLVTRFALVGDPAHVDRLGPGNCDLPNEWPTHLASHFQNHFASIERLGWTPDSVASIAAPVLTIHGTRDRNAPYGSGREWAMLLPEARLVTVEGAAHCSWADDPDRVFGAIDAFLAGSWPAGAEQVQALAP